MSVRKLFLSVCLAASFGSVFAQEASKPPAATQQTSPKSCNVDRSLPTEADVLFAKENFSAADAAYRAALEKTPASVELQLGLTRTLIEENKVVEAQSAAATLLTENPQSALAEVIASEAAYRAADLDGAFKHAKSAVAKDSCEGRALIALANIYSINALFETAARFINMAHKLRPNDELIRRSWTDSLPRQEREKQIPTYLAGVHNLSDGTTRAYNNELQHLKARKPGECKVTSKEETTATPLQLVYGDNQRPVAYGLDALFDGKHRRMQIDTGASGILLTEEAARALGLQHEYDIQTAGIGDQGARKSFLSHVKSIRIGDVQVENCMVEVVSGSKLDVDGLIGMDVFRRWIVTLDYQNAQLRLSPLPDRPAPKKLESDPLPSDVGDDTDTPQDQYIAPEMKDWVRVPRAGHNILLPARVRKDSPLHYVIMDTGSQSTVLSTTFGEETGKLHGALADLQGLSGKVNKTQETNSTPMIVAGFILPQSTYLAADLTTISQSAGLEVSGLFGLPTLQRLTIQIDYRDNLLKLSYDPKHDIMHFY